MRSHQWFSIICALLSALCYGTNESQGGIIIRLDEVTSFNSTDPFASGVSPLASADESSTAAANNAELSNSTLRGLSYIITADSNAPGDATAWVSEFTTELRNRDTAFDVTRRFIVTVAADNFTLPGSVGDLLELLNALNLTTVSVNPSGTSNVLLRSFADVDSGELDAATYLPGGSAVYTSSINDPNVVDGFFASSSAAFIRSDSFTVGSQAFITLPGATSGIEFEGISTAAAARATAVVPEASSMIAWALCLLVGTLMLRRRQRNS